MLPDLTSIDWSPLWLSLRVASIATVLSLGIGQKFYFSPTWAIRFDLRGLFFNGPDPLSVEITEDGEIPPTAEFEKRLFINTFLTASFVFVL